MSAEAYPYPGWTWIDFAARIMNSQRSIQATYCECCAALIGRRARIVTDWNGQPYGRSRPSLKGLEAQIVALHMDPSDDAPQVLLEGQNLYIDFNEIEVLP